MPRKLPATTATSLTPRSLLAASLCLALLLPPGAFAQPSQQAAQQDSAQNPPPPAQPQQQEMSPTSAAAPSEPLQGDAKILQALNRFTYGPRPGDLERVRALGLNAWFLAQLTPASIDDSALEARLTAFPALSMPLNKMMELYPTNAMVRQMEAGRLSAPRGDAARAIYADQRERYDVKKKKGNAAADDDDSLPDTPAAILAQPPDQRFKTLSRLSLGQLKAFRAALTPDQRDQITAGMSPQQIEAFAAFNSPRGVVESEDIQVKLLRDIYSERQLNEIMVDFWLNHFNVYMKKSQQAPYYIAAYERAAIRPHALGKFENLLAATAMSPAMLNYLDNSSSIGPHSPYAEGQVFTRRGVVLGQRKAGAGLNENYGRELMELHTVGVNGGYTQQDVTEVAKVFTGWTVGKGHGGDTETQAEFDATRHEPGDKMVLGHKIKSNGSSEGMQVLHLLATSPQTAHFICTKLAVRFVADDPPPALVDRMAATFLSAQGDIRRVLLTMINSPEFFTTTTYRHKVKTPQEYVVSAVRAAGSDVRSAAGLATAIEELGMPLYGMQTPNGYSMRADPWNNTAALVSRMNFALALSTNRVAGVSSDFTALLGQDARNLGPEAKDVALEAAILHVPVSPRTQQLIVAQTGGDAGQRASELNQVTAVRGKRDGLAARGSQRLPTQAGTDTQAALASGLIFGSPEFQRR